MDLLVFPLLDHDLPDLCPYLLGRPLTFDVDGEVDVERIFVVDVLKDARPSPGRLLER